MLRLLTMGLLLLSSLTPLSACAHKPVEVRTLALKSDPALTDKCHGFKADPPPAGMKTQRPLSAWIDRTYTRGLQCEAGVERLEPNSSSEKIPPQ